MAAPPQRRGPYTTENPKPPPNGGASLGDGAGTRFALLRRMPPCFTLHVPHPSSPPLTRIWLSLALVSQLLLLAAVVRFANVLPQPSAPGALTSTAHVPSEPSLRPRPRPAPAVHSPEKLPESARALPVPAASDAPQRFFAALPLGERIFVLERQLETAPRTRHVQPVETLPLTQGNVLLLEALGPAPQQQYSIVNAAGTCSFTPERRVALELDSGDPGSDTALGPGWQALEGPNCAPAASTGVPVLAVAGSKLRVQTATVALAQRVKATPALGCGSDQAEFVEAVVETSDASYAIVRSAEAMDWLALRPLPTRGLPNGSTKEVILSGSLYWDGQTVDC